MADFDWLTVLASGVTAAAASQGLPWLKDHTTRKSLKTDAATYAAIRLAVTFERFAIDCAQLLDENATYESSGGHHGTWSSLVPSLLDFPTDVEWQVLTSKLAATTISFRNSLKLTELMLGSISEFDDSDYHDQHMKHVGRLAHDALNLASSLRKEYSLPSANLSHITGWDLEKRMHKANKLYWTERDRLAEIERKYSDN